MGSLSGSSREISEKVPEYVLLETAEAGSLLLSSIPQGEINSHYTLRLQHQ